MFEDKDFKPFFLNFGNSSKLFPQDINKKKKILIYKENEGKLFIYPKHNLQSTESVYLLKMASVFKILTWKSYFLVLAFEDRLKLKIVSKKILEKEKKSKGLEVFHVLELDKTEIVN